MKPSGSKSSIVLGRCMGLKMIPFGSKSAIALEWCTRVRNWERTFYLSSGVQSWPPLGKFPGELPSITDCLLRLPCLLCLPRMRHPQSLTTCRAKPGRAKRGSAVTRPSEARCLGRAKRGVTPSLARAAKQARMRFNCRDSTAASKRPWSAGKRALHERDIS